MPPRRGGRSLHAIYPRVEANEAATVVSLWLCDQSTFEAVERVDLEVGARRRAPHRRVDHLDLTELLGAMGRHCARQAWADSQDSGEDAPDVPTRESN